MTPQTPQISRNPILPSLANVFGSYGPQHFENIPSFTSLPIAMSIEIPDAINNELDNSNTRVEGNELDDFDDKVDRNGSKDASEDGDTTIQDGEPSIKKKRTIIRKHWGLGVTIFTSMPK